MINKILIGIFFVLLSSNAYAEDLIQILSKAFENNSKLNAQRASLAAEKQDVNISKGDFFRSFASNSAIIEQRSPNSVFFGGAREHSFLE